MRTLIIFAVLFFFSGSFSHSAITLDFGLYATDKPTVIVKKFRPILNHLESALGAKLNQKVTIRTQIAKKYDLGIEALASGKVDFARFGPASYVKAKEKNDNIKILAMESKNGSKRFKGVICVHKDSTIKSINELEGKNFAFGSPLSTIGRYLSQLYLAENGIRAPNLGGFGYLGRHDKVGHAVGLKKYDAGALKEGTFKKLVSQGVPISSLAEFYNVTKPWLASSNLDPKIVVALRESLLELEDTTILETMKITGFTLGSDDDYELIRKAILENDIFFITP